MKNTGIEESLGVLVLCDRTSACRSLVQLLHSLGFDVITIGRETFRKRFSPSPQRLSMVDLVMVDLGGSTDIYPFCDALMQLQSRPALMIVSDISQPFLDSDTAAQDRVGLIQRPFSGSVLKSEIFELLET